MAKSTRCALSLDRSTHYRCNEPKCSCSCHFWLRAKRIINRIKWNLGI